MPDHYCGFRKSLLAKSVTTAYRREQEAETVDSTDGGSDAGS
jgi:hypothetical protein